MSKYFCPLRFNRPDTEKHCLEEECAWYLGQGEGIIVKQTCAIFAIAFILDDLVEAKK